VFKDTFCSSPWFHIRILPNGNYNICRWANSKNITKNIANTSIQEFYNSNEMQQFRLNFLDGKKQTVCESCYYQDSFEKLSGRKKQLLKSGITDENFDIKTRCSPHFEYFKYSFKNEGKSNYFPVDLQIDLGNVCNSSCIMCDPKYSSRLSKDYQIMNQYESKLFPLQGDYYSWTNDDNLVQKFIDELIMIPNIKYIHFIGGETLHMKSFYKICDSLIENKITNVIIGTTTNATIFNEKIEKYIKTFKQFHLGISIETVSKLNDYVRYPSKIEDILNNINKYKNISNEKFFINLRITPNIFTIYEFDQLAEYIIENKFSVESCDILSKPSVLRIELLPNDIRQEIIVKLENIIKKYNLNKTDDIINVRNNIFVDKVISNNIIEYYNLIKNYTIPKDVEEDRYKLIRFICSFEKLRKNSILNYAPRYKKFLTDYGY